MERPADRALSRPQPSSAQDGQGALYQDQHHHGSHHHRRAEDSGADEDTDADAVGEEVESGRAAGRREASPFSRDSVLKRRLPPLSNGTVGERTGPNRPAKEARMI